MKKRLTILIIGLIIVFGGIIAFNLIKSIMIKRFFASYKPPAVSVSSVKAKKEQWKPTISAVGNFIALNGVDVNSEAAGNVVKIHFDSGEYIKRDDPLIDLDDSVDQATLKFNEAELTLQKINYKRQTDLYKRGATPSSNVDEARANLLQAEANVQKTQATINQKHIKAPFSGKLGIRQVNLGEYISPGQTKIVSLQSLDPLFLEFYLPEQLLKKLSIGQDIIFSVEQNPELSFVGKITAINSKVDINTHNVLVQATVPNCPSDALTNPEKSPLIQVKQSKFSSKPIISCSTKQNKTNNIEDYALIPGMFAAIEVDQPVKQNKVILPSTAISYSLYGNSVFLIGPKDDSKDKEDLYVKRVFVRTGDQRGNYTVIEDGVEPGQMVVNSGQLKLEDGTRVTINNSVELKETKDVKALGE